jgi:hypothetical protein
VEEIGRAHESIETFMWREDYQKSLKDKFGVEVKYGEFASEFRGTFGSDYTSFAERSAAVLRYDDKLWKLTLNASTPMPGFVQAVASLPTTFSGQPAFFKFFKDFGAYVVNEVIVGGALDYAMLIDRTEASSSSTAEVAVRAEYGAFFKGNVDETTTSQVKKLMKKRSINLSVTGGNETQLSGLSFGTLSDQKPAFETWKGTIKASPKVIAYQVTGIEEFCGPLRDIVFQARLAYVGGSAVVESDWRSAKINLSGALRGGAAAAIAAPVIQTVLLDRVTLKADPRAFQAPDPSGNANVGDFWKSVKAYLEEAKRNDKLLILATERWPRDQRYFPAEGVEGLLGDFGATKANIDQWKALSVKAKFCPYAGMSYVLAGAPTGRPDTGADSIAFGFGNPEENTLEPAARISVFMSRDASGRASVVSADKPTHSAGAKLTILQNTMGPVVASNPDEPTKTMLRGLDRTRPEQLWYMQAAPNGGDAKQCAIINYLTCTLLQAKGLQGSEASLQPWSSDLKENMLWESRGPSDKTNFLLRENAGVNLNLTNYGANVVVHSWGDHPGMFWVRHAV